MTSSSNLLNLVSHLQSMEMSFTSILMETAMKLSALTDANIFVLVETGEGRKICGKRHLCDAYLSGNLIPTGQDVEFEVNPLITALHERQANLPETYSESAVFPSASSVPLSTSLPPSSSTTTSKPNFSASTFNASRLNEQSGFQRKRQGDQLAFHSGTKHFKPILPKRPALRAPEVEAGKELPVEDEVVSVNIKEEPVACHEGGVDDSLENDGINADDHSDEDIGIISEMSGDLSESKPGISNPLDIVPWMSSSATASIPAFGNDGYGASLPQSNIDLSKLEETLSMDVSADKLEALQTLPPREIFMKGTVGYRVLNSVMYEIGRSIAMACASLGLTSPKDPESKTIFSSCFDKWISDNLAHLATSEKKIENLSRSPLGFMKQNARVHFYKVMSTLLKDRRKGFAITYR